METSEIAVRIRRMPGMQHLPLPAYQTAGAAAMDVVAAISQRLTLPPSGIAIVPAGFAIALPNGYEAQLRPRSGLASKHGITLVNSPATIDADYRGEVKLALINMGTRPFTLEPGMRVAQLLVLPVPRVQWIEVAELPPTDRDTGGFGHTGH